MPKIVKIPLIVIAIILGMGLLLLAVFQTSWLKNYAADKATKYLSEELNVEVSIDEIKLNYFDQLTAKNLYIADHYSDTLFHIQELTADYDLFSFSNKEIRLNNVVIDQGTINIGIPENEKNLNLQFLIDYFTPASNSNSGPSPKLVFDKVELVDTKFNYFNSKYAPPSDRKFDENNMLFSHITGHLHDFEIINDSLNFVIDDISGNEKSGLSISNLSATSTISSTAMKFENLLIETPKSKIKDYLHFKYANYADFSEFIEIVKLEANLKNSKVHTDDLALFSNYLNKYNELIQANGEVSGTIDNLKSTDLQLMVGNHTNFDGSAHLKGLPNINTTRFDVNAKKISTKTKDLARLIDLKPAPKEFLNLGKIRFVGTFKGLITDFTTKAEITSDVGPVIGDLRYSQPKNEPPRYLGTIRSNGLNIGSILGDNNFGNALFDLAIDGTGISTSNLSSVVTGSIESFEYSNYNYQNITLNGNVNEGLFAGKFKIADPNYRFDFDGKLDLRKEEPLIAISANVASINLKTLGIDTIDSYISFNGDVNLRSSDINEIEGDAILDSFSVSREGRNYVLRDVKLKAEQTDENKNYTLKSDITDIAISGDFLPSELKEIIAYIQYTIYPSQFIKPETQLETKTIKAVISVDDYKPILSEVFGSALFDSAYANLAYDHTTGKIESTGFVSEFKYDAISTPFIDLKLKNGGNQTPLNFGINTGGLNQNDSSLFGVLNANGFIKDGIVNFETTSQKDSILDIVLAGKLNYEQDSVKVYLEQSKVDIYDKPWNLRKSETPNIIYTKGVTEFRYFFFENGDEILFLDASLGDNADKINATVIDFKLENLTPFTTGFDIQLQGITNGFIDVSDREGFPIIEADLEIADLQLDKDTLGTLKLISRNKNNLLAVAIDGQIEGGLLNDMKILGDIDFKNRTSPLNLNLTTYRSSIKPFEKYLKGLASNISGFSTTDIKISGPLLSPNLDGTMQLDSMDFQIDYLQTSYKANAALSIDHSSFSITEAILTDQFGQIGVVNGMVSHKNFNDFLFDIKIEQLNNFEIMNTGREDNELFYGTAFVDGSMLVSGQLDDILLQIKAKSRKGTEIFIPLDNSEASGKLSYVDFVNLKEDNNQQTKTFKSIAGVRMDFNFEVTNDANITLIFDELLGDKIEAAGHGNLRMEINTYGDFNMYGGLTIDNGSYLFTALDLLSKQFKVKPGGTLFWDGNPYNAKINLDAITREYPVPLTLVEGSLPPTADRTPYQTAIPADCYLKLSGLLFNPEVSFDLEFPYQTSLSGTANSTLNTVIERIKIDQEELNRQVFALLVLGTFIPPSFATSSEQGGLAIGAANTGINSLSDFASSQLNNWLSQLDSRLQVGVDYQTSLDQNAELVVSLRRKFLNDRLELSGSVDAAAQGSRPYDISLKYDITEEGNLKVRGFQKQANDPTLGNINNVTTTGVGLFYRYQFDRFRLRRKKVKPE